MIQMDPVTRMRITKRVVKKTTKFQRGFDSCPRCRKKSACTTNCIKANPMMAVIIPEPPRLKNPGRMVTKNAARVSKTDDTNPMIYDLSFIWFMVLYYMSHQVNDRKDEYPDNIQEMPEEA